VTSLSGRQLQPAANLDGASTVLTDLPVVVIGLARSGWPPAYTCSTAA